MTDLIVEFESNGSVNRIFDNLSNIALFTNFER